MLFFHHYQCCIFPLKKVKQYQMQIQRRSSNLKKGYTAQKCRAHRVKKDNNSNNNNCNMESYSACIHQDALRVHYYPWSSGTYKSFLNPSHAAPWGVYSSIAAISGHMHV